MTKYLINSNSIPEIDQTEIETIDNKFTYFDKHFKKIYGEKVKVMVEVFGNNVHVEL